MTATTAATATTNQNTVIEVDRECRHGHRYEAGSGTPDDRRASRLGFEVGPRTLSVLWRSPTSP